MFKIELDKGSPNTEDGKGKLLSQADEKSIIDSNNLLDIDNFKTEYRTLHKYFVAQALCALERNFYLSDFIELDISSDRRTIIEHVDRNPDIVNTPLFKRTINFVLKRVQESGTTDREAIKLLRLFFNLKTGKQGRPGAKLKLTADTLTLRRKIIKAYTEILNLKNTLKCRPGMNRRFLNKESSAYWKEIKRIQLKHYQKIKRDEGREHEQTPLNNIFEEIEENLINDFCTNIIDAAHKIVADEFDVSVETLRRKVKGVSKILRHVHANLPISKPELYNLYKMAKDMEIETIQKSRN